MRPGRLKLIISLVLTFSVMFDAFAGTMSGGGGGDYDAEEAVTDELIESQVRHSKSLIPFVLNHFESQAHGLISPLEHGPDTNDLDQSIVDALFPKDAAKKDVFERLNELRFVVRKDQPCYDEFGTKKAASAYPYESNEICFSALMIRDGASSVNLLQRITALAIHEITHKMGIENEEHTRWFEMVVYRFLPRATAYYLGEQLDRMYREGGASVKAQAGQIMQQLKKKADWGEICYSLSGFQSRSFRLGDNFAAANIALMPMRAKDWSYVKRVQLKSKSIGRYCTESRSVEYHNAKKLFAELKEIQVAADHVAEQINESDPVFHGIHMSRALIGYCSKKAGRSSSNDGPDCLN